MKTKSHVLGSLVAGVLLASPAPAQQMLSYFASSPVVWTSSGSLDNWSTELLIPAFDPSARVSIRFNLSDLANPTQSMEIGYEFVPALTFSVRQFPDHSWVRAIGESSESPYFPTVSFQRISLEPGVTIGMSYLLRPRDDGLVSVDFRATATFTSLGIRPDVQLPNHAAMSVLIDDPFVPIPEPSVYAAVMGFAALGMAFARRRRNARV